MSDEPRLSEEDQARVDHFISTGVNSVERRPFRPFRLLLVLILAVSALSVASLFLASLVGVY